MSIETVQSYLVGAPATGLIEGKHAWAPAALRGRIGELLSDRAAALGYTSPADLLADWTANWADLPPSEREAAVKLSRALRRPLQLRDKLPPGELLRIGLEDWRQVHGYAISEKTWWKRLGEVVQRDGGLCRFERLQLYVRERARPTAATEPVAPNLALMHAQLLPFIQAISDPMAPDEDELAPLRHHVFSHFELLRDHGQTGMSEGELFAGLARYIAGAIPGWVRGGKPDLLRRALKRFYRSWVEGGRKVDAVTDGRRANGRLPYSCDPCGMELYKLMETYAAKATAWREAWTRGLLCDACRDRYSRYDIRKAKSAAPRAFLRQYAPNKITTANVRGGKREAMIVGPHPTRTYHALKPGDVQVHDDLTSNERVSLPLPGGRWDFWKLQVLAVEDLKSGKILDFVIHYGHPSSWSVRTLQYNVFTNPAVGMPRKGQIMEKGVYASKLVKSTEAAEDVRVNRKGEIPWAEFEAELHSIQNLRVSLSSDRLSLERAGIDPDAFREAFDNLKTVRATSPMAKTIEGTFHNLQRRARALPGHLGFQERFGGYKRLQEFMDRCRVGKAHPSEAGIMTIDEYRSAFRQLVEEYNAEPQNARRCRGASPDELWSDYVPTHPLEKLPEHLGYIFMQKWADRKVKEGGIIIKDTAIDRYEPQVYYGPQRLGELIGQRVRVRYNPQRPEVIWVRVKDEDWFKVPRQQLPAWGATREEHKTERQARWQHMAPSMILAGNVRHPSGATIEREDRFPDVQHDFGAEVAQTESALEAASRESAKTVSRLRRKALERGMAPVPNINTPQGQQAQRLLLLAAAEEPDVEQ
jgi:hypothetical protein